jgi:hypothetical protein
MGRALSTPTPSSTRLADIAIALLDAENIALSVRVLQEFSMRYEDHCFALRAIAASVEIHRLLAHASGCQRAG